MFMMTRRSTSGKNPTFWASAGIASLNRARVKDAADTPPGQKRPADPAMSDTLGG
jgi:hypothetical protein